MCRFGTGAKAVAGATALQTASYNRRHVTVGLTLGKFAPLHRGHQLLIETALRETDHVIVLIYPAVETDVPLTTRANWIRALYPAVEVIEAWDGPDVVGLTPEITRAHDDYIGSLLKGRGVTHFFSSEPYGEHVSRGLGAEDRRIDPARTAVPISSTMIRADPFAHRRFIDPLVYADLITRVVFAGAPSTGKTTLAERLAARYGTVWMPEYGREYWEKYHTERRLTPEELVVIGEEHRRIEDEMIVDANRFLFVDTEAIITALFARYYHGRPAPRLAQLADESPRRYDLFFFCENDFPYADTPDRSGEANQRLFQLWIRDELAWRKIPHVTLRGSIDERLETASRVLERFQKFNRSVV